MQIFTGVDDKALLNLSEESHRFEGIAKTVFKKRYTHAYFVIDDESESKQEMYWSLFSRFGEYADIKAIEATGIRDIENNHWLPQLLQSHTKHLEKLTFDTCTFKNVNGILSQHLNLTHLVFKNDFHKEIQLPTYQNLIKLDLSCSISFDSLKQLIVNNRQLESLLLHDCCEIASFPEIIEFIADNLSHLRELALKNLHSFGWDSMSYETVEKVVDCLKHLELLALGVDPEIIGLLNRLSFACSNIKHLEIDQIGENLSDEMLESLCNFKTVESLAISQPWYDDAIVSKLIQYLPKLRHFSIIMGTPNTHSYVLLILQKCSALEKISIDVRVNHPDISTQIFVNATFFKCFRETIQENRNVRIEFKEMDKIIGHVTTMEIVWRNKMLHWIGWDPSENSSNLNLLDLANHTGRASNAGERCPFDLILDYLDLGSIQSMSQTCRQSEKLVNDYVKRHAENNRSFIITDEFCCDEIALDVFAYYVENLKLHFFQRINYVYLQLLEKHFEKLKKLWYFSSYFRGSPRDVYMPQIRHFIFVGSGAYDYCDLSVICELCPQLEQLEFRTKTRIYNSSNGLLPFNNNLKKLIFKRTNKDQDKAIADIFEGSATEVIAI